MNKATLSWGECEIAIRQTYTSGDVGDWALFPTPVDGSAVVETDEGELTEARVEIGLREALRRGASNYALSFDTRQTPDREDPIDEEDGIAEGEYSVLLMPEHRRALYIYMPRTFAQVSVSYAAAEGITKTYRFETLPPTEGEKLQLLVPSDVLELRQWEWQNSGNIEWMSGETVDDEENSYLPRIELLII